MTNKRPIVNNIAVLTFSAVLMAAQIKCRPVPLQAANRAPPRVVSGHEAELEKLAGERATVKGSVMGEMMTVQSVAAAKNSGITVLSGPIIIPTKALITTSNVATR